MTQSEIDEIRKKVLEGTQLAIDRMIERKRITDSYLVVSRNGKVVKIRARDIAEAGKSSAAE